MPHPPDVKFAALVYVTALAAAETKISPRLFASLEMLFRVRVGALYQSMYSVSCHSVALTRSPLFDPIREE